MYLIKRSLLVFYIKFAPMMQCLKKISVWIMNNNCVYIYVSDKTLLIGVLYKVCSDDAMLKEDLGMDNE